MRQARIISQYSSKNTTVLIAPTTKDYITSKYVIRVFVLNWRLGEIFQKRRNDGMIIAAAP